MKPLIILLVVFILTLLAGYLFTSEWELVFAGNLAMSAMLMFTALGHFKYPHGMSLMVPDILPFRVTIIHVTGLLEIAAAIGLMVPTVRHIAAVFLIIFFIAILPANIYGTDGDWETYSTPSRDARLKTAFKELRDEAQRFVTMYRKSDPKLAYRGNDLVADLLNVYDQEAAKCHVTYARTDGSRVTLGYDEARRRLFLMSFDPYHCIERRWGATDAAELSTCRDGAVKQAWYAAEQNLRNQIDRTYDAQMNFTLAELRTPGAGKGAPSPPDIDARAYLVSVAGARRVGAPASR